MTDLGLSTWSYDILPQVQRGHTVFYPFFSLLVSFRSFLSSFAFSSPLSSSQLLTTPLQSSFALLLFSLIFLFFHVLSYPFPFSLSFPRIFSFSIFLWFVLLLSSHSHSLHSSSFSFLSHAFLSFQLLPLPFSFPLFLWFLFVLSSHSLHSSPLSSFGFSSYPLISSFSFPLLSSNFVTPLFYSHLFIYSNSFTPLSFPFPFHSIPLLSSFFILFPPLLIFYPYSFSLYNLLSSHLLPSSPPKEIDN